ncbi:MAG: signal peptidase I [Oscillospiraceae bacterium]|nr:signal peptidase I [Oscillospiraceae bacterium]
MKKVLKTIANVLSWAILAFVLLITILVFSSGRNNGVANLFGYIPLTVESDSMLPTFAQGDLIICKEIDDLNSLKENDVITFWTIIDGQKVKNTHRIIEINEFESTRSFVTRGDNNSLNDDMPAYAGDLIGKWTEVKISGMGKVMNFLRTKTGFFICILIPMAIFFLFELYKFIVVLIEIKRPAAPEIDEEEIKRRAIEEYLAEQKKNASSGATTPSETEASETSESTKT